MAQGCVNDNRTQIVGSLKCKDDSTLYLVSSCSGHPDQVPVKTRSSQGSHLAEKCYGSRLRVFLHESPKTQRHEVALADYMR